MTWSSQSLQTQPRGYKQRNGQYNVPPQAPKTLGVEFSGIVEKLAAVSCDFKTGDEVFGLVYRGAYAEYIAVSTKMLIHKPEHLSWEKAAGIPEIWITANQAMYLIGEFSPGKLILWYARASLVAIAGTQLLVVEGASKVFSTVGSDEKAKFGINKLGATAAFNYRKQDWA